MTLTFCRQILALPARNRIFSDRDNYLIVVGGGIMGLFDVIVIGAGVTGCAVARELSRYRLKIGVLEKEADVACGNSSRNSGVLHGALPIGQAP